MSATAFQRMRREKALNEQVEENTADGTSELANLSVEELKAYAEEKGIDIADKLYDFSEFRAFGVIDEPGSPSIIVLPVKRFSTGVTLYFNIEDGERIVDMLGARLPLQEVKLDLLEKVIRLIKL